MPLCWGPVPLGAVAAPSDLFRWMRRMYPGPSPAWSWSTRLRPTTGPRSPSTRPWPHGERRRPRSAPVGMPASRRAAVSPRHAPALHPPGSWEDLWRTPTGRQPPLQAAVLPQPEGDHGQEPVRPRRSLFHCLSWARTATPPLPPDTGRGSVTGQQSGQAGTVYFASAASGERRPGPSRGTWSRTVVSIVSGRHSVSFFFACYIALGLCCVVVSGFVASCA